MTNSTTRVPHLDRLIELVKLERTTADFDPGLEVTLDADGIPAWVSHDAPAPAGVARVLLAPRQWENIARYLIDLHETETQS